MTQHDFFAAPEREPMDRNVGRALGDYLGHLALIKDGKMTADQVRKLWIEGRFKGACPKVAAEYARFMGVGR